jgi:Fe-S cluster assembly protein SufD
MMEEIIIQAGEKREIVLVHSAPETAKRVIRLAGEGAEVQLDEIFLANAQSDVVVIHDAMRTKSRVNVRGIVSKGHTVSHAKIIIPKNGQLSDSFVTQHFMLMDESAEAEAIPSLEIEADEVKASHAATVAPLDENKIFYLKSRGIKESDARKLIIESFLNLPKGYEHLVGEWQE